MSAVRVSWSDRMSTMQKLGEGGSEAEFEVNDCKSDAPAGVQEEDVAAPACVEAWPTTVSIEGESATAGTIQAADETVTPPETVTAHSGGAALDLHWLLKTANPNWTARELTSAREKLKQVGIISYAELEDTLQGKGLLNNLLRDQGLKAFGTSTLDRLRNAVESEKERQRQATLLVLQRERRRLDQETRSRKAIDSWPSRLVAPATLPISAEEGRELPTRQLAIRRHQQEQLASMQSESSSASAVAVAVDDLASAASAFAVAAVVDDKADVAATLEAASAAAENDLAGEGPAAVGEGDTSAVESDVESEQFPNQFRGPSQEFRHGLADGLDCGLSWEWPLTRDEKKERITMLDRQVLWSYKKQLEELQAKVARKDLSEMDSSRSYTEGEDHEPSSDFSPKIDSDLGIHIAG